MVCSIGDGRPLCMQIAAKIEASSLDGSLAEGDRCPWTNERTAFYRVTLATACTGINLLVDRGILEKRRGLGTFVAPGAQHIVRNQRVEEFAQHYLDPLLAEARAIGLDTDAVLAMLRDRNTS